MAEAAGERVQEPLALVHRRVDREHVRDVQAKPGLGQRARSTARARRPCGRSGLRASMFSITRHEPSARYARGSSIASGCTTIASTSGASRASRRTSSASGIRRCFTGACTLRYANGSSGPPARYASSPGSSSSDSAASSAAKADISSASRDHRRPVAALAAM